MPLFKQSHTRIPEVVCCVHVSGSSSEMPIFNPICCGCENEHLSSGRLNHTIMSAGPPRFKFSKKSSSAGPSHCREAVLELLHLNPRPSWEAISLRWLRSHVTAALLVLSALSCCRVPCREPTHLHLVASLGNKNAPVQMFIAFLMDTHSLHTSK